MIVNPGFAGDLPYSSLIFSALSLNGRTVIPARPSRAFSSCLSPRLFSANFFHSTPSKQDRSTFKVEVNFGQRSRFFLRSFQRLLSLIHQPAQMHEGSE